jgi:hypothetical protein
MPQDTRVDRGGPNHASAKGTGDTRRHDILTRQEQAGHRSTSAERIRQKMRRGVVSTP